MYKRTDDGIQPAKERLSRPRWNADQWKSSLEKWATKLHWDVMFGAFDGDRLVGMGSLRYRLADSMAQLVSLHVSRAYRRQGIATRLTQELIRLAQENSARALYVSATPSESAIGFYTSQGFAPTEHVNKELLDLEPEDIHMIREL